MAKSDGVKRRCFGHACSQIDSALILVWGGGVLDPVSSGREINLRPVGRGAKRPLLVLFPR